MFADKKEKSLSEFIDYVETIGAVREFPELIHNSAEVKLKLIREYKNKLSQFKISTIMEFKVTTSGYFYPDEEIRTELEKIGFTFEPSTYKGFSIDGEPTVEIKDLNELIQFADKWGKIIVGEGTIEIYDDCRE